MESKKRTLQTMSPLKIGNVEMQNPLVLAPMAGVTDLPFRVLCKEQGAGLICMEMVSAKAILYKNKNTEDLMTIHPGEHPVSLQLFGSDPEILAQIAAQIARKRASLMKLQDAFNAAYFSELIDAVSLYTGGGVVLHTKTKTDICESEEEPNGSPENPETDSFRN